MIAKHGPTTKQMMAKWKKGGGKTTKLPDANIPTDKVTQKVGLTHR